MCAVHDGYYSVLEKIKRRQLVLLFRPEYSLVRIAFPCVYAPGTIAVNVTRLERGFNACNTTSLRRNFAKILIYTKLSCAEESMAICSAVLIQYQRVKDGQTDGRPAYS